DEEPRAVARERDRPDVDVEALEGALAGGEVPDDGAVLPAAPDPGGELGAVGRELERGDRVEVAPQPDALATARDVVEHDGRPRADRERARVVQEREAARAFGADFERAERLDLDAALEIEDAERKSRARALAPRRRATARIRDLGLLQEPRDGEPAV